MLLRWRDNRAPVAKTLFGDCVVWTLPGPFAHQERAGGDPKDATREP